MRDDKSIFVSLASYRDENCPTTLKEMYSKADHPELLYIGLVQQVMAVSCFLLLLLFCFFILLFVYFACLLLRFVVVVVVVVVVVNCALRDIRRRL